MVSTALLIPVFNNDWAIEGVVRGAIKHVEAPSIFVVNDGSTDKTLEKLKRIPGIRIISFQENRGKGAALVAGLNAIREAGFDFAVTMDGDGQHAVDDLPRFLEAQGADIFLGARDFSVGKMPFFRIISNRVTSALVSVLSFQKIRDSQTGFRKLPVSVSKFPFTFSRFQMESELLLIAGTKGLSVSHVPIQTLYNSRVSSMHYGKDTALFILLILKWL